MPVEITPEHPSVAILGAGAMGEALLRGLLAAGWSPDEVVAAVRRPERAETVARITGCRVTLDPAEALAGRQVIVVATKPRDVGRLLDQIDTAIAVPQVLVSVAAGVPIATYEARLAKIAVIRAMPNTPALVGEGVTGIAAGGHAGEQAVTAATAVLSAVGEVRQMDESLMDAVTAVSGTGPAYVFLLAEALIEAAIREGLPRDTAETLVYRTVRGAGHLLTETDLTPAELRAQVTSPGGTTAAAIHILEEKGFRAVVEDAVRAAAERSRQLGETNS
jgi:pyrroline-5-carboxylate reductase